MARNLVYPALLVALVSPHLRSFFGGGIKAASHSSQKLALENIFLDVLQNKPTHALISCSPAQFEPK